MAGRRSRFQEDQNPACHRLDSCCLNNRLDKTLLSQTMSAIRRNTHPTITVNAVPGGLRDKRESVKTLELFVLELMLLLTVCLKS